MNSLLLFHPLLKEVTIMVVKTDSLGKTNRFNTEQPVECVQPI